MLWPEPYKPKMANVWRPASFLWWHYPRQTLKIRQVLNLGGAVPDFVIAGLTIQAANRRIKVQRCLLDFVKRLDIAGAQIDKIDARTSKLPKQFLAPLGVSQWIESQVDAPTHHIARIAGADQRHKKVGAFAHAINRQGLAEIFGM